MEDGWSRLVSRIKKGGVPEMGRGRNHNYGNEKDNASANNVLPFEAEEINPYRFPHLSGFKELTS